MSERTFTFVEPHITGGHCTVEITESQILKYMRERHKNKSKWADATDNILVDEFCIVHWCSENK